MKTTGGRQGLSLQDELRQAERAYSAFLPKVRKEDKEQASLMTVEPLRLKEVQELLDPGTTLLEYFVADREVLRMGCRERRASVPEGRVTEGEAQWIG